MFDPSWQLHPKVHPMTVGTFLDCVMDVGAQLEARNGSVSTAPTRCRVRRPACLLRMRACLSMGGLRSRPMETTCMARAEPKQ